ncbi:uncharacterized protein N7477_002541 [Penicillium maclennaniae]|uniref:uncharacterized protein n=1 Tax=Penicillium maclennaniae TaxID=1343394 RepID=UPI00254011A1|nr:uncharacterized protein N7477_002541 [Penicillium maclennaniae]KAJ5676908.1 hypothetical protein N7477_002541 [Penicillium maclennaniae]
MLDFRPQYWSLIAILLAIIHPSASYPIVRTPNWIKKGQHSDLAARGTRKFFEKNAYSYGPALPQLKSLGTPSHNLDESTIERGPPGRLYKRDTSYGKTVVSVLVPVAPDSLPPPPQPQHHRYDANGMPQEPSFEMKPYADDEDHYGEVMKHPQPSSGKQTSHTTTFSSATLKLASGNSISFFSYRISLPFLKFAPANFPQYPLPRIFTTVMVLLAMVWIAIFMIGLVELGNYLWKRRATRQADRDEYLSEASIDESEELIKVQMNVMVLPRPDTDHEEEATSLSSRSDSDSGSDSERDDYRF